MTHQLVFFGFKILTHSTLENVWEVKDDDDAFLAVGLGDLVDLLRHGRPFDYLSNFRRELEFNWLEKNITF